MPEVVSKIGFKAGSGVSTSLPNVRKSTNSSTFNESKSARSLRSSQSWFLSIVNNKDSTAPPFKLSSSAIELTH
ncbi:hypothetical protein SB749_19785, partial [Brevibacterium sp. SIMBA_078]|uniref:hypothetical protein n=1 Tax=Brevibacterium sp. SIMBA_078 TaxID=3085816 RepID=UPI00397A9300